MTEFKPNMRRGYLYGFLAAICAGLTPALSKLTLPDFGPAGVAGFGFLIAGAVLLVLQPKAVPKRSASKYLLFFGIVGVVGASLLYQVGLNESTAVNASLLANGETLFTTIIAFAAFGERLGKRQLAQGLLIVAGIIIVSTNLDLAGVQFFQGLVGNLLILGSMLLWSFENNILITAARRFGPLLVTRYRNLIGGGVLSVAVLVLGLPLNVTLTGVAYILILGVDMGATSYLAIVSLAEIGAIREILVFSTSTIFGAVFAIFLLHEQITPIQILGGALILSGVYLLQRSESKVAAPPSEEFR